MFKLLENIKRILNKALSYIISFLLILMTALVLWQVFTRYILGNPSIFTEELVTIILIWTSFLGAAYAFGTREHMSLVFLKEGLSGARKNTLMVTIDLITLIFTVVIFIIGGSRITMGVIAAKTPILQISKGYIYSSIFISGIIIVFFQLINIIEDFKTIKNKEEK